MMPVFVLFLVSPSFSLNFLVIPSFVCIFMPSNIKRHNYENSANFAVNIKTSQILPQFLHKIENAAKLKNATNVKPV